MEYSVQFSSVQSLSRVWLFATPWTAALQASLSITNSQSSLRLTSIESVMSSSHLILCRSLLLLPPIPPSIRIFSNKSTLHMRWPKYWSFSISIIPHSFQRNPRADLPQNGLVGSQIVIWRKNTSAILLSWAGVERVGFGAMWRRILNQLQMFWSRKL